MCGRFFLFLKDLTLISFQPDSIPHIPSLPLKKENELCINNTVKTNIPTKAMNTKHII
jgi:hypothetical protein